MRLKQTVDSVFHDKFSMIFLSVGAKFGSVAG